MDPDYAAALRSTVADAEEQAEQAAMQAVWARARGDEGAGARWDSRADALRRVRRLLEGAAAPEGPGKAPPPTEEEVGR